jgi:predicted dehydrogenase
MEYGHRIEAGRNLVTRALYRHKVDDAAQLSPRAKRLAAAVNFQLRFAPMMLAVRDAIEHGLLGSLVDVEVHLAIFTPWHLFAFMKGLPRI